MQAAAILANILPVIKGVKVESTLSNTQEPMENSSFLRVSRVHHTLVLHYMFHIVSPLSRFHLTSTLNMWIWHVIHVYDGKIPSLYIFSSILERICLKLNTCIYEHIYDFYHVHVVQFLYTCKLAPDLDRMP